MSTASAKITAKALTLAALNQTKTYDGDATVTSSALGTGYAATGFVSGEGLSGITLAYDTQNAGTGKTISISGAVADASTDLNNYAITYVNKALTIDKAALTLAAVTDSRDYDGGTTSSGVVNISGLQGSDTVSGLNQSFASKNVLGSNGSTLQVNSGYTVNDGNSGNNYTVVRTTASGTINKKAVTLTALDQSKTYDGNTGVTSSALGTGYTQSGFVSGEGLSGITLAYDTKNAGTGKTIAISDAVAGASTDLNNYQLSYVDAINSSIARATLDVTANAQSKFVGSADPALTYRYTGLKGTDTASVFSGALDRDSGETVGVYAIGQGTLDAGSNYDIAFHGDSLTIADQLVLPLNLSSPSRYYRAPVSVWAYVYLNQGNSRLELLLTDDEKLKAKAQPASKKGEEPPPFAGLLTDLTRCYTVSAAQTACADQLTSEPVWQPANATDVGLLQPSN